MDEDFIDIEKQYFKKLHYKIILAIIVEGTSDKNAIGGISKEYFFGRSAVCCSLWRYYIE